MCVCVFGIHVLKIGIERWFWEVYMVFGSLVELPVGLHSCLCFSLLKKLLLKASSTPSWYLAICRASYVFSYSQSRQFLDTWWIDQESSYLLNNFLTASRSIEPSVFVSDGLFLDTSSIPVSIEDQFLDTFLNRCLDTFIYRDLLRVYLNFLVRSDHHFFRFLSRLLSLFSPKQSYLTPILILKVSSSIFKIFFTW